MNGNNPDPTAEDTPEEPMDWPTEPERRDEAEIEPREIGVNKDILRED